MTTSPNSAEPVRQAGRSAWTPSERARERERYRTGRRHRATALSVLSTVLVLAVVSAVVLTSPGWERTRATFFDPGVAWGLLPDLLQGLWLNIRVWLVAGAVSMLLGVALALLRTSRAPVLAPVRLLVIVYVDVFRGLPLLLVLLLIGFGLPSLRVPWIPNSAVFLGTLAIVLTYSAFTAEIVRSGIDAVPPAQVSAARALGLSRGQTARAVVLPQAGRNIAPALLNVVVSLQKDSGLISVLGAVDAIRVAEMEVTGVYNFTPYVAAGVLFLLISIPLTRAVDSYTARRGWGAARPAAGVWR